MYCITQSGTPVKILVKHSSVILHYTVRGFPVRLHYTRGFTLGECASMQKTALVPHKRQKGKRRGGKKTSTSVGIRFSRFYVCYSSDRIE